MTKAIQQRRVPGISVYPRGNRWAYIVYGEPHILTKKRDRFTLSGFDSYDEAWDAALQKQAEVKQGRTVKPSARTVDQFFTEWLRNVKPALKPTAYANYKTNVTAYIRPTIGHHRLQEVSVPILNAFYVQLRESGRVKPDNNAKMYAYWCAHRSVRDGRGPTPTALSRACEVSYQSAKEAVTRYRRGRVPAEREPGLSAKSVRNVHRLIHRAFSDAVAWQYVTFNPAEHAILPREPRRRKRATPKPWTVEELAAWLRLAMTDRFAGMWVLAATTGTRRSELLGVRRENLDLDAKTLKLEDTLVSAAGKATESDGKSEASERTLSLDEFTVAALLKHLEMLDTERKAFGKAYPKTDWLFVWEDGKRPHPDTVTDKFNRLVDQASARRIRLHDIRHTWVTLARNAGVDGKVVSDRVGHASESVTQQIYTHRSIGFDRAAATLLGDLIKQAVTGQSGGVAEPGRE